MKTNETPNNPTKSFAPPAVVSVTAAQVVYRELSDQPVQIADPLQELRSNLQTLQDLQDRFRYLAREVKYITKA